MEGVQCCGQRNDRDETGKVRTTINLAAKPPSLYDRSLSPRIKLAVVLTFLFPDAYSRL